MKIYSNGRRNATGMRIERKPIKNNYERQTRSNRKNQ